MTILHSPTFVAPRDVISTEQLPLSASSSDDFAAVHNSISISAAYITKVLGICTLFVVIAGIITSIYKTAFGAQHYIYIFNLDEEANIPSWFSSQLLFINGLFLATISLLKSNALDRWKRHWWALSFVFFMLSLDEVASIHEHVNALRDMLHLSGILYFAWVIPAAILLLIFGISYLKFVFALPSKTRWLFIVAAIVYVGGALGMEMVDGAYASIHGTQNLFYALLTCTEETCEMVGMVIFAYALTDYLHSEFAGARLHFNR